MSDIVPSHEIEAKVGAKRHAVNHLAQAVDAEQTVYVLHSHECLGTYLDLRNCPYSIAIDKGIRTDEWTLQDRLLTNVPVLVAINNSGRLVPVRQWHP